MESQIGRVIKNLQNKDYISISICSLYYYNITLQTSSVVWSLSFPEELLNHIDQYYYN
ncbi:MAG: hypothetical protein ACI83D_000255 [Planctomycetota bacterium]|jgi:hypothetical protein